MTQRFLLDVSPTGVQHSVEINHDGDEITLIEHTPTLVENVILDENQRIRSLHQKRSNFQLAAKIPINTYQAWKKEWKKNWADKYTWPQFEVIQLNNRDNCKLRTGNKRGAFGKRL